MIPSISVHLLIGYDLAVQEIEVDPIQFQYSQTRFQAYLQTGKDLARYRIAGIWPTPSRHLEVVP